MKQITFLAIAALFFMSCGNRSAEEAATGEAKEVKEAVGSELTISPESKVNWRGTKPGGEHYGIVSIKDGSLVLAEGEIQGGKIVIDLMTIESEDLKGNENMKSRLEGHLLSEDFFYTEQYPEAVFEIVSIEDYSGESMEGEIKPTHEITGNLTMRGKTNSITFPAMVEIQDGKVMAKTTEFAIDRTKWDVNFKSKTVFAEFKDDFINDMMNLQFDVVFVEG